ncbi:unnamed protein product [Miscanthus lutarioriparius]|uniref:Uncharacterized protein n=1 Tax=Miscanthus lutarioriparius TaxID=422564 RepID=A0A811MBC9_9POAL|nr:unnamed protein product [Miscanthus lutarioriparius]
MFDAGGEATRSVADMVPLVDTLQRLGIDNHFRQEVDAALKRINSCESLDDGLQIVALRFRLLRQHGVWVPADVFDRFRDERTGSFSESLASDPRGLLSLYNAAHMATPGEQALDEAISFSRRHLASMNGRLPSPLEEQVSRALDIPLARLPKRLETCVVFHEEEYSRARMLFAKTFGLLSLMDDTYDVYATLEECHILNDAIQRWDETTASILPEYMKMFYINLVRNFQEFEHSLQPNEKYRVSYAKQAFKLSSKYYLDEAKWCSEKYAPSFKEHMEVTWRPGRRSSGRSASRTCMVTASGEVARFLNDIASYKKGKNKKDVASSVECYAKEHAWHVRGGGGDRDRGDGGARVEDD